MRTQKRQVEEPVPSVVREIARLRPDQLDLLESELVRQEEAMTSRGQAASTRANVLLGASAVLGGAELVTVSGLSWLTAASLLLYLLAALAGLMASRSRMGKQPSLPWAVHGFVAFTTISLRRDLFLGRLRAQQASVQAINRRHRWLVGGVIVLSLAWASSAAGVTWAMTHPQPMDPLVVHIDERE